LLTEEDLLGHFRIGGGDRYGSWDLQFMYRRYRFLVESNSHAALEFFWVSDPSCPKAVLLKVLEHSRPWLFQGGNKKPGNSESSGCVARRVCVALIRIENH
jgi:hypothetical protein